MNLSSIIENALGNIIADLFVGSLVTVVITKFFEILQQKRDSIGALTLVDVEIKVNAHRLEQILKNGVEKFEEEFHRGKPDELSIDANSAKDLSEHLSKVTNRLSSNTFYATSSALGNLENKHLLERIVNLYQVSYLDFQIAIDMGQINWKVIDAMKNRLKREIQNSNEISQEIGTEIDKLAKINALWEAIKYLFPPIFK